MKNLSSARVELRKLCSIAKSRAVRNALVLAGPRAGKTELLKKTYDRLFVESRRRSADLLLFPFDRFERRAIRARLSDSVPRAVHSLPAQ